MNNVGSDSKPFYFMNDFVGQVNEKEWNFTFMSSYAQIYNMSMRVLSLIFYAYLILFTYLEWYYIPDCFDVLDKQLKITQ